MRPTPNPLVESMTVTEYRVAGTTRIESLAGAITHAIRRAEGIDVVTYGLKQVGIATQAVALAREFLLDEGLGLDVEIQKAQIVFGPLEMRYGVRIALRPAALYREDAVLQVAQAQCL